MDLFQQKLKKEEQSKKTKNIIKRNMYNTEIKRILFENVPIIRQSHLLFPKSIHKEYDDITESANKSQHRLISALNKHIKKFDQHRKQKHALIINPGIKTKESFLNKANGVFEGDYTQILDLYRASIIVENLKDIPILLNNISDKHSFLQQHFRIVNKENKFKKPTTYKSIKINIYDRTNGLCGELQILTCSVKLYNSIIGRKNYEKARKIERKAKQENRELTEEERIQLESTRNLLKDGWENMNDLKFKGTCLEQLQKNKSLYQEKQ